MWNNMLSLLRASEFWAVLAQAIIQASSAPVPDEFKTIGWAYIALRVASKLAKYVFPNPAGGGWFKNDSGGIK